MIKLMFSASLMGVAFIMLSACQTTTYAPIAYSMPDVPNIRPVRLNPVEWKAYNKAELLELLAQKGSAESINLVAVTPEGYKNLTLNLAELERYIRQQKQIIVYLKKTLKDRSR